MANNPNDNDPKPVPPNDPLAGGDDSEEFGLERLSDGTSAEFPSLPEDEVSAELPALPDEGELSGEFSARPGAGDTYSEHSLPGVDDLGNLPGDDPSIGDGLPGVGADPDADPASLLGTEPLGDLPDFADAPPAADARLDSAAPVAPSEAWLDVGGAAGRPAHLEVNPADLFEGPQNELPLPEPPVESSDIFGPGPPPRADRAETSDVISATASGDAGPANPDEADRPSDFALTFDLPPGGSTMEDPGGSENLPLAEELPEGEPVVDPAESLFHDAPVELPFDSAQLAAAPDLPGADEPTYGRAPDRSDDASSILAALNEPDPGPLDESSVRLDAPGVDRTHSSGAAEGTEFDLTVSGDVLPELDAAEAAASGGDHLTDWEGKARPAAGDSTEADFGLPADQAAAGGSDIFAGRKAAPGPGGSDVPLAESAGGKSDDSAVEFSDHPDAEDEASLSRVFRGPSSPTSAAIRPPTPPPAPDFDVPADSDADAIDWSAPAAGVAGRAPDASPSEGLELGKGAGTSPDDSATRPNRPLPPGGAGDKSGTAGRRLSAPSDPEGSDPSVEIDWMSGSSAEQPAVHADEPPPPSGLGAVWGPDVPTRETRKAPDKAKAEEKAKPKSKPVLPKPERSAAAETARPGREPARSGKGGWVGGTLLGMVIAGGACAGVYFGGLVPNSEKTTQVPPGRQPGPGAGTGDNTPVAAAPTAADVAAAVRASDWARAKKLAADIQNPTPADRASHGAAQLFALVQERLDAPIAADDADLKAARENLQALVDNPEAPKTREEERAAVQAAIQIGVTHELAGDFAAARKAYEAAKAKFPKYAATIDASLDRLNLRAPAGATPEGNSRRLDPRDARRLLLAVTLLQADPQPKEGKKDADDTEAGVFFWKAVNKAAAGEYAEAVKEIQKAKAAHVKQAKAMAGRGLNPLSDPLEQIFPQACDELKAYWELRGAIYGNKSVAELIKKDGVEKALAELAAAQKTAAGAAKLAADLKEKTDQLTAANEKLTKAEKDLDSAKNLVTKLDKDVKDTEAAARKEVEKARDEVAKARKDSDAFIASIAKELQAAKLLAEKYDHAALLAATKTAADRATGPNLATLLPTAPAAVAGAGLSTAQLLDIAGRLARAEAAAKAAADKLVTETKRLEAEHAVNLTKLKDAQAAELKKATDKYADDAKKLTEAFAGKLKDLEAAVAREKGNAEAMRAQFKKELGNAISPSQALDLWLPILVDLRRPSDADPALATANQVIASAGPNSEDAAKARTVAGLASLYKKDFDAAKRQFQAARSSAAYEPAKKAEKPWAVAADVGLASVADPLAPYRRPPELPKSDPVAGKRFLDAGVKAYRDARYSDAVSALTDAAKADPTNPLAWYFLGAARWEAGSADAARDDFRQGRVREAESDVPTRTIDAALAPIQGPARDALTAARR